MQRDAEIVKLNCENKTEERNKNDKMEQTRTTKGRKQDPVVKQVGFDQPLLKFSNQWLTSL